jgi:putative thiamine transport system permease protein
MFRVTGAAIAFAFFLPLLFGLVGSVIPAFGLVPSIAEGNGFVQLFDDPRFLPSIWLSLKTGITATVIALIITIATLVCVHGTRLWRFLIACLPPLLAVPHAALAVGLIFLIAPSGWLVRLISPELTGWTRPPTDWVVPDSGGWSLILGLVIKETPFLLLTAAAQLSTLKVDAALRIGRTLGYAPARCWSRLILPRLYPRMRLTLLIVLAFNLSVVDVAILLGPGNPPTFSVFLLSLVNDPGSRAIASAGALVLAAGVALVYCAMFALEKLIAHIAGKRRENGHRGQAMKSLRTAGQSLVASVQVISIAALVMLLLWSFARRWRFPNTFPTEWTPDHWTGRAAEFASPLLTTLGIALMTLLLALASAIAWLECERRGAMPRLDWLWYIPLLIPQVTLLFGWQAVALFIGADGQWLTVVYSHWVYALPYVVLLLAVAWRELDPNWNHAASVLGAGYWRTLFRVRIPLLIKPVSQAAAVALAVSVAQYLPTLLLGAGRHQTLAIELVTSFSGVDRRIIATLATMQSLLPLLAFCIALWLPRMIQRQTA